MLPDKRFVMLTAQSVRDAGVPVTTLDLAESSAEQTRSAVEAADLVVVGGGHAIYLLEHVHRTRFDRLISERVSTGDFAYAGISAGAALAGPDLSSFADDDDPGRVDIYTGLALVPFVVLPHRNRGQADRHDALSGAGGNLFLSINDDQAICVSGRTIRIVSTPR